MKSLVDKVTGKLAVTAKEKIKRWVYMGVACVAGLAIAIYLISSGLSYLSGKYNCHTQWQESGFDYKYTYRAGCLIQKDGKWIPEKNLVIN